MLETFFFILGLVNSILLIIIFLVRRYKLEILRKAGWTYLLLAMPAAYGIFLSVTEKHAMQYTVFLSLFLAFLVFEWLYDFILKLNFRENWRQNWKWLVPYLFLYYATNYGFIVMPLKTSGVWGIITAGLFVIQIIINIWSHPRSESEKA
jgi:hypothetical protein